MELAKYKACICEGAAENAILESVEIKQYEKDRVSLWSETMCLEGIAQRNCIAKELLKKLLKKF